MAFASVQHHVEDGVALVDQHIQVGQRARHGAPKRGLPHRRAAAHHGHRNGGAQRYLRERIHRLGLLVAAHHHNRHRVARSPGSLISTLRFFRTVAQGLFLRQLALCL
jgi:hypothetical protein